MKHQMDLASVLNHILENPGEMPGYFSTFHNYSILNQVCAAMQLKDRGLPIAPIASFMRWKELGRSVKAGQKALVLCQPFIVNNKDEDGEEDGTKKQIFLWKARWFSLDQTEGKPFEQETIPTPEWDEEKALATLNINKVPFANLNGNVLGYACKREIAVSPVAPHPQMVTTHEIAHVVLGHTEQSFIADGETLTRSEREFEAEGTAFVFGNVFGLPGVDDSKAYVRGWGLKEITAKMAAHVLSCVDKIIKAGLKEENSRGEMEN